jgi:hypothetical protein
VFSKLHVRCLPSGSLDDDHLLIDQSLLWSAWRFICGISLTFTKFPINLYPFHTSFSLCLRLKNEHESLTLDFVLSFPSALMQYYISSFDVLSAMYVSTLACSGV